METQSSAREEFVFWTTAPYRASPTSCEISEEVYEDEYEEQAEDDDDDFASYMDENGIIGLSEAVESVGLGAGCDDAACYPNLSYEPFTSSEAGTPLEELCHIPNEYDESAYIQTPPQSPYSVDSFEVPMMDESGQRKQEPSTNYSVEEEKDSEETDKRSDSKQKNREHFSPLPKLVNDYFPKGETEMKNSAESVSTLLLGMEPTDAQEISAFSDIEAESLSGLSCGKSLSETHRSSMSLKASSCCPQTGAMFSEEALPDHHTGVNNRPLNQPQEADKDWKPPTPSSKKMKQHAASSLPSVRPDSELRTTGARKNVTGVNEIRVKATPDYSKVQPRVKLPEVVYNPPKSRCPLKSVSLPPERPTVFKSHPTTVNDAAPCISSELSFNQLKEEHKRLLIKYADAENTIDRLRLEDKVNMFSDPPKTGHSVQSVLKQCSSKFLMLDFPQAQRAEISSFHPEEHTTPQNTPKRSPDSLMKKEPTKILCDQANQFLQELQMFEDLLKCKKLKSFEQVTGLSQLDEALWSLERSYLLARKEHKHLLWHEKEGNHFDPDRELEGLIVQFGLHVDELKEQVEQQDLLTRDPPPSSPPNSILSSAPSEWMENLTHSKSPLGSSLVDTVETAAVMAVCSAGEESDVKGDHLETVNSLYLKPQNGKHRHVEGFTTVADDHQCFKEISTPLAHRQKEETLLPAALNTDIHLGGIEKDGPIQRTGNVEVQRSPAQRNSDPENSPPHPQTSTRLTTSSSPHLFSQSTSLDPSSGRRNFEVGSSRSSSLSSLGEMNASETKGSKRQIGSSRVPSQDGLISPETDSGFIGSDSSHLIPAAAPSPVHQVKTESVAIQVTHPEMRRLQEKMESCQSSVGLATAQEHYHHRTSTPRVSRRKDKVGMSTARQTIVMRPHCDQTQKNRPNFLASSEQPQPLVSRCTQTSSAAIDSCCSHTNTVRRRTCHRNHPSVSVCEAADEPDSRRLHAPLCLHCPSSGVPAGYKEQTHSFCSLHCCHCRSTEPDTTYRSYQNRTVRPSADAPPPAPLPHMPVCHVLLCSSPHCTSPSACLPPGVKGQRSEVMKVRGHEELKRSTKCSSCADRCRSTDSTLKKAIRAARHMKFTSGRISRALRTQCTDSTVISTTD